jgi:nucleotide-binding universal stress UspA family protein
MGLKASQVTPNIQPNQKLWRYMSLERLIDILSRKKLFFASLNAYAATDPFEGLLPKIALDPLVQSLSSVIENEAIQKKILEERTIKMFPEEHHEKIKRIVNKDNSDDFKLSVNEIYFRVLKSTVISCWHQNKSESEAMWKLYAKDNKGIAIQTTAQNLIESIDDERVFFSEVRYVDFYDESLKNTDLVVNGFISPLLKREAFDHEKEARLFFTPIRNYNVPSETYKFEHEYIDVDVKKMISKIYISPHIAESDIHDIKTEIQNFGINENMIVHSNLLTPDEYLTKIF